MWHDVDLNMLSAQVFLWSKLSKTFIRQFRAQLLAEGKSFTDNQSLQRHHLIKTNKSQHLQTWQSELETELIKNCEFFWNCEMTKNREDNQLQPVHLTQLGLWHFPLTTGFVDAIELKLLRNPSALIYLSFHSFTGICCIVSVVVVCRASTV